MILVDTCVWSLAFRRTIDAPDHPAALLLRRLIEEDAPLVVPGIVLQELLSRLASDAEFKRLRKAMSGFPLLLATESHHLRATRIWTACRQAGVVASSVDSLIAAMSEGSDNALLTTDRDFHLMAPHCGLRILRA